MKTSEILFSVIALVMGVLAGRQLHLDGWSWIPTVFLSLCVAGISFWLLRWANSGPR